TFMNKVFFLSTCSTCKKILKSLDLPSNFEFQDIKTTKISESQLDEMAKLAENYENLFSKRSRKYTSMNLNKADLNEEDFKKLILEEYTFLKRPVICTDNEIFIGSSKKEIERLQIYLKN